MNQTPLKNSEIILPDLLQKHVDEACSRIAPTWPLDQLIAVNPWWELRAQRVDQVSAKLAHLGQMNGLMPKSYFLERWGKHIQPAHLLKAMQEYGITESIDQMVNYLKTNDDVASWQNISHYFDQARDLSHAISWNEEIVHQISQHCANFFQQINQQDNDEENLYTDWLDNITHDKGIAILMSASAFNQEWHRLPSSTAKLIQEAVTELGVPEAVLADYFHALLLSSNGWASWVAYKNWQKNPQEQIHHKMEHLLATRLAWELVLWRYYKKLQPLIFSNVKKKWLEQCENAHTVLSAHHQQQQLGWVWQRAMEVAYQQSLSQRLSQSRLTENITQPVLQAVFCIDVRSEVFRRHLEAQHGDIQTFGFAGFFGLPIEYQPQGSHYCRPQLPGLLQPAITVQDHSVSTLKRNRLLNHSASWQTLSQSAHSSFSFVESVGISYVYQLIKDSFFSKPTHHPVNDLPADGVAFSLAKNGKSLSLAEKTNLALTILNAMGLTESFAPIVLLVGHGSATKNNPQAAALDCGACCGQTGEVNARVLAQLLNDKEIRHHLAQQQVLIPESTVFIAGLHNTTTDDIALFDVPHELDLEQYQHWLATASQLTRKERALKMNIDEAGDCDEQIRKRSVDWSQVRPEWGLANNACFIVAPRHRTRHLNFEGRSFLHDYVWQKDTDFKILELIMTAPMVVTHWINFQYYTSVTDNDHFGTGNKVLHNIVGGHFGVFEGNGGDLRIGLSLQSLHDGQQWMHEPLRLSVFIDAPRSAIEEVIKKHQVVSELINNEWLYLFQMDEDTHHQHRYYRGDWSLLV